MTALGVSLLIVGAIVIVVEAHVPTLGILGGPGVIAVGVGAVLAVSGLGGGAALAAIAALVLVATGLTIIGVSLRKGLAVRRRRVRAGPEGLIGHLGVVRNWTEPDGSVLVDGCLWRARRSILDDDDEPAELHAGDRVVVEHLSGLTVGVRRAEDWEVMA
jgi:membrane-bound serine protease (ClpP class)